MKIGLLKPRFIREHRHLINQPDPSELSGTKLQTKNMEGPMASATYVTKDDLVGHEWEERPLVL